MADTQKPRPKKRYGQNFLVNAAICPKMVAASGVDADCCVLEIGAGYGALTREIAKVAEKVVALEIDADVLPRLTETVGGFGNVKIIQSDVLKTDLAALLAAEFPGKPVRVLGNLPYYITSPILMQLLESRLAVESVTVMVQKEAAVRFCASPGSRECGAVSLAIRYYSAPRILFDVSPGSFYPVPKVSSCVIQLDIRKAPAVTPQDPARMFRVIRAAFSQRRKTAQNAISAGLNLDKAAVAAAMTDCGIRPDTRAERMTLADFSSLSDRLAALSD